MALVLATVHGGVWRGYDRQPVKSGKVTFTPKGWLADPAAASEYVPKPVVVTITDGEITATLVGPDTVSDPQIAYQVDVEIESGLKDSYTVLMPSDVNDGDVLELASRDPDTGLLSVSVPGGGGGGFGGAGNGGFGA